ncbi:RNA-binding domain-containing protein [uncultured Anaerococcus sp.]|uniref:RNA-binding domain-containing protein n=1 Tax=uncultured Anaerococcus sp. TaxID=293428 RepID=UPI0028897884|nr:RNA-binding domain-containing protein [uncultured Anaerococcus sp.]
MRETFNLEFKERITDSFLKTVVAYSNYTGGKIIFGVDDNGKSIGIDNPISKVLDIENKINDSIKPQANYNLNIVDNNIIELIVYPGNEKPYFYKSKSYKRNDSATIEIDTNELKHLILEGNNSAYDQIPTSIRDYNFTYLEKKLKEQLNIKSLNSDILKTLELVDLNNNLTNAGNLLADKNKYHIIDLVRFGKDENTILTRKQIKNISILEAYDLSIDLYREYYHYEVIKESYRKKIEKIPEKAFREAIANALVHRNWMTNSYIQVSMKENSISITSPGGLPSNLTANEYLNGEISIMQNPIIGNVFFRLNIIESFGTGIARIKSSYKDSKNKPGFQIFDNSIEVFLPETKLLLPLSEDELKVYHSIKNKSLASSEIAALVGFGKNKVLKILNNLIEKSYAVKNGNGRGTKYSTKQT